MGWLIALGVLILLVLLPVGVSARYDASGFFLKLILGPVSLRLLPQRKKSTAEPKKKKKSTPSAEKRQEEPAKSPEQGGSWKDFLPLVKTGMAFLGDFRRKLRIRRLELKLTMAGDDPCDLALNYGRANAALGNLWPMLERCFVIKKRNVQIQCDFESAETVILARADATITLGRLLRLTVRYGIRALKDYLHIQKSRKGGASQ